MNDNDTNSTESQPHCTTCGVPWVDHMGIVGTCAENAQLRKERDEARREVCKKLHRYPEYIAECRGWDCYKEGTK